MPTMDEKDYQREEKAILLTDGIAMTYSASRSETDLSLNPTIAPGCALPLLSDSAPVQNRDTKADWGKAP